MSPAPAFILRPLVAADAPEFRRVRLRALADHPDVFTSTHQSWDGPLAMFEARIAAAHIVGAFIGEELVGTALLAVHHNQGEKLRHKVEVWSVYVAPEARGLGIARAMMEEMIAEARRRGYDYVKLGHAAHNESAGALYRSLGFVEYGREPDHLRLPDGRSIDHVDMQLRL